MTLRRILILITVFAVSAAHGAFAQEDAGWEELENWAENWSPENETPPAEERPVPELPVSSAVNQPEAAQPPPEAEIPAETRLPEEPSRQTPPAPRPGAITRPARPAAETMPETPAAGPVQQEPVPVQEPRPGPAPESEGQPTLVRPAITSSPPSSSSPRQTPQRPGSSRGTARSITPPRTPITTPSGTAIRRPEPSRSEQPAAAPQKNLFAEHFYMNPDQKLAYQTSEAGGFIFLESPGPGGLPAYSLVTDFGGNIVQSQKVEGVDLMSANKWVRDNTETQDFEGVEVRRLTFAPKDGPAKTFYFVGQKGYTSMEKAAAEIAMVKAAAEMSGGNFNAMVREAQTYPMLPEEKPPVEIEAPNFEKEEELFLKMFDALDIGSKLYGPFHGEPSGEPITWQSFSETSWRRTNLENYEYSDLTTFWTNRVVLKGIRAPLSTIDPFVEATMAMESDGTDFKDNLKIWGGLEWRPLSQNPWLYNFRPYSLALLDWVRNYRFYVMYGQRFNIKDEIGGSVDYDLNYGVQIFYEWGIDLPPANAAEGEGFADFLREYVWGEYFGNYRYEMTGFSAEENPNTVILNSSVILGVRLPGIPLPPNPINEELQLMPYLRFEHVNSTEFSFPFQNRYFLAAGVRWMPFRSYRYKGNEWLSKVKLFGEYVGIGDVQHFKQDGEAPNDVPYDLRFGINVSSNRY